MSGGRQEKLYAFQYPKDGDIEWKDEVGDFSPDKVTPDQNRKASKNTIPLKTTELRK